MSRAWGIVAVAAVLLTSAGCLDTPVPNLAPEVTVPEGPPSGQADSTYEFTTSAIDPEGELVSCRLLWGDGDSSDWSDFVAGGTEVTFAHAWTRGATFEVAAQAKDEAGVRAEPSGPAVVVVTEPPAHPNVVLDTIDIPTRYVQAAAASPDGRYVYFAGFDYISVVDVAARRCVDSIEHPLGDGLTDMCISPDGRFLYACACCGDLVVAVSTETGEVVRTVEVAVPPEPVGGIGVHPDGQHIYVSTFHKGITVDRASDFEVEAYVEGCDEPSGLAVTPDGRYVCVASYGLNHLAVYRTADNTMYARIPVRRRPMDAVATPDSRSIYVCCEDVMYVVRTDDLAIDTAFQIAPYAVRMAIQPSGDHIYVVHETGFVSVVRTADNRVDLLGPVVVNHGDIACVPGDKHACIGIDSRHGSVILLGTEE